MSLPEIPGYRLVQLLHEGSRVRVYLAEQRSLQRLVALKLLCADMAGDPIARRQLIGEGKSAARMSHPNLLAVFDIGEVGGVPYIATEYLPKGSLRERLDQTFDAHAVLRLARDLAQGLKYLHEQGFLHRDLKPANIYFRDDGTAVLADAGITRQDRAQHPDDGYAWSSPYYMCPEQAQGDATDARSDLYSLGAMLYEVLAGRPPFDGDDPMALAMAHVQEPPAPLPAEVRGWQPLIDRLLAKEPQARLPDADTLLRALERIAQRLPPAAAPATPAETLVAPRFQAPAPAETTVAPRVAAPVETTVAPILRPGAPPPIETVVASAFPTEPVPRPEAPFPPSTLVLPAASDAGMTAVAPPMPQATRDMEGTLPLPGAPRLPDFPPAPFAQTAMPPAYPAETIAAAPMPPPVPADGATVVRRPLPGSPPTHPPRASPWPWIVLSVMLVVGTIVLFLWWGSRSSPSVSPAPQDAPEVPAAESAESAEALAAQARRLEEREELINPDGDDNAVQAWRAVLERDSSHREAQGALIRIRATVHSQIAAALRSGQLTTARALLEQAVEAFPDDPEFRVKLKELNAADR
ncbi:MAG: protein kinase [Xanthomonadales bacterium]|jgi:serine/threonine-protein kinase PpkA|nr:protein kinase [Xanthomonadales bacterium]